MTHAPRGPLHRPRGGILASLITSLAVAGCGGGMPMLHPAQTLRAGELRAAGGVSANVAVGSLASDLRTSRAIATQDPTTPGDPGSNPTYAKGALVAAAVAPGIAPFVAARVGVGNHFEGGIGYTGRAIRADLRHSFERGAYALSVGLGASAALYGRQAGSDLPSVDLKALHGYGLDLPLLAGWRSAGGLYDVWGGARAGFEHDVVESLTTEPSSLPPGAGPVHLDANRFWGGGVLGLATGFRHVHVALELDVAYQLVNGTYNGSTVTVKGLTLTPASALWWSFLIAA